MYKKREKEKENKKKEKRKENRERIQAMNIDNKGTIRLMND